MHIDHATRQDDRWMFASLRISSGVSVRSDFEGHLKTANADMIAALTKSTEVIEQIQKRLEAGT
jgi:hypothetical protein